MKPTPWPTTLFARPDNVMVEPRAYDDRRADLWVCTVLSNHMRWRTRWKLWEDFIWQVRQSGAKLACVEVAFGERRWVTDADGKINDPMWDPATPKVDKTLHLRTTSEIWTKEKALNLLVERLPVDWQYVAFVDADCHFARSDWANETVQQLQHYPVIQMWSQMIDLGPNYEVLCSINSFISNWLSGELDLTKSHVDYPYYAPGKKYPGAPGLAWAWRREAFDMVGRLIDWGIIGAGDSYMAYALIGKLVKGIRKNFHKGYSAPMFTWQDRAERYIQRNVGCMDGLALHYYHGAKMGRNYGKREQILVDTQFNPESDLKADWQGLWQLVVESDRQRMLRDRLMAYFRERDEDAR